MFPKTYFGEVCEGSHSSRPWFNQCRKWGQLDIIDFLKTFRFKQRFKAVYMLVEETQEVTEGLIFLS